MRKNNSLLAAALVVMSGCSAATSTTMNATAPQDPRIGLRAGLYDAAEAVSNLRVLSRTKPSPQFENSTNSDLAFTGKYAIQGSYNGFQVWDISNPTSPVLTKAYYCPASQSDVSVYHNLLFVSSESPSGRLDCGAEGVKDPVSAVRLRGLRIFDITDIANPKYISNVQTCRGSHTHTLLEDPNDKQNVYIYISGSSSVRPAEEMPGCVNQLPNADPNSALFRIEVIKVPLAHPEQAAIVASPRIFNDLTAPARHADTPEDVANARRAVDAARARGAFVVNSNGQDVVYSDNNARSLLDSVVAARGGSGAATRADSAAVRMMIPGILARNAAERAKSRPAGAGPTQCHDITVYPSIGLAGGACEGYGLLLDIRDPANPRRIGAVADSNFSYWHSATFNNDGTKVLFSDEWGGGSSPKCRASDPKEWGADAIFTVANGKMDFQSYYKLSASQTSSENCVAHNGSLIPIPGRDVMAQSWYQGGISVFDWTDAKHPMEIASYDRGPVDSTRLVTAGTWSVYWYNGKLVSSEIARGLDIAELTPSQFLTQNEIDAAKTVHYDYLNAQGQPKMSWPPSFALARAYMDQLERNGCLAAGRIAQARSALSGAETASGAARRTALTQLASQLQGDASASCDAGKVGKLADATRELAGTQP